MRGDEFLSLANRLANDPMSGPAAIRTAISRAYYGAFLSVLSFVKDELGISCRVPSKATEHQSLPQLLANCKVALAVDLGQRLTNLHQSRKEADYEMDNLAQEKRSAAVDSIRRATLIFGLLNQCKAEPTRSQIAAGLMQYRKLLGLSAK